MVSLGLGGTFKSKRKQECVRERRADWDVPLLALGKGDAVSLLVLVRLCGLLLGLCTIRLTLVAA